MTALSGSFDLQSEPGKGTVASLHLPFTASVEIIEGQVVETESPASLENAAPRRTPGPSLATPSLGESNVVTPLRVLIVDDHQMVREGLRCILEEYDDFDGGRRGFDGRASASIGRHTDAQSRHYGHAHAGLESGRIHQADIQQNPLDCCDRAVHSNRSTHSRIYAGCRRRGVFTEGNHRERTLFRN